MTDKYYRRLKEVVFSIRDNNLWNLTNKEYAEFEFEFFKDCEPKDPCKWCEPKEGEWTLAYRVTHPIVRWKIPTVRYCPNCGREL